MIRFAFLTGTNISIQNPYLFFYTRNSYFLIMIFIFLFIKVSVVRLKMNKEENCGLGQ